MKGTKGKRMVKTIGIIAGSLLAIWLVLEIGMRIYVEFPLKTDFYGSIPRDQVPGRQAAAGVKTLRGPGWVHLGWIANPDAETYRIDEQVNGGWVEAGRAAFGSFLLHRSGGTFRVMALPKDGRESRVLGEATVTSPEGAAQVFVPRISGAWQTLFRPEKYGNYINDHALFQDAQGTWRLVGITSRTDGDFNQEKYFATAFSTDFPPAGGMTETTPVADFGGLAWAPDVIRAQGKYVMFWSPHQLNQMESPDGVQWTDHQVSMQAPYHKFFRDAMVLPVASDQWLLYSTARGAYYSQIDVYQSFDLTGWQYIGTALRSGWGSERNSPFGSMESPYVVDYQGGYYLSLTYNNDSFFYPGILMMFKVWINPASYNDTLVFHSDNPYDFGLYRGRHHSPSLLTSLSAHAPEIVHNLQTDRWYITTAGWPWVSTLTHGEVAVAPLEWEKP